jgi:hypothetical protein
LYDTPACADAFFFNIFEIIILEYKMHTLPILHVVSNRFVAFVFFLLLSLSATRVFAQINRTGYSELKSFQQDPLDLVVDINTEFAASQYYTLSWSFLNDNSGRVLDGSTGEYLQCFVYDSEGLIGSFENGQLKEQRCGFFTTDWVVEVFFRVRPVIVESEFDDYYKRINHFCDYSEFRKIRLIVKHTKSRQITLFNNTGIVTLTHVNRGALMPDNMPCINCCNYDMVLVLSKPYISVVTGKILYGNQWVNRYSIERIVYQLKLVQIDPSFLYQDKRGNTYSGQVLMDLKQVDTAAFDMKQFKEIEEIKPAPNRRWQHIFNFKKE